MAKALTQIQKAMSLAELFAQRGDELAAMSLVALGHQMMLAEAYRQPEPNEEKAQALDAAVTAALSAYPQHIQHLILQNETDAIH